MKGKKVPPTKMNLSLQVDDDDDEKKKDGKDEEEKKDEGENKDD